MCGIGGIAGGSLEEGERINYLISHRGPDYSDVYYGTHITLSHTLLSIRSDRERSRQPWTKQGSPWVLVYNGQLYNVAHIKKQISKEYATEELDTALLYALIEKEGWNFITHIQGMFAIGLYNTDEKRLRLYRDPSGQKKRYTTLTI